MLPCFQKSPVPEWTEPHSLVFPFVYFPGGTRYLRAFKKVFEILNNTLKSSPKEVATRPVVILLFTDGAPKTKDIKRTVVKSVKSDMEQFRKQYTGKSLKLLTVALGADDQCRRFTHRLTKASVRNDINLYVGRF